jgi:hypothetical protein
MLFFEKTICENFNISSNNIICVKAAKALWWIALHFVELQTIYLQGFLWVGDETSGIGFKGQEHNQDRSPWRATTIFLTFSHRVHHCPYEEMFRLTMSWNQITNVKLI